MAEPSVIIKDLLVTAGIGTLAASAGWALGIGPMMDQPDTFIAIKQTGGQPSNPKWAIDYPSIQVVVRGATNGYANAIAKARAVKDALLGLPSQNIDGDQLVLVNAIGDINDIGQDEKLRPKFTLNFSLIIEPGTTGNRQALPA